MNNISLENAISLFRNGQLGEAIDQCEALLESTPNDSRVLAMLGEIYGALKQWEISGQHYKHAIEIEPERAEFRNGHGLACLRQHKYNQASMAFLAATQLKPDFALAHFNLAVSFWEQGNPRDAISAFRRAITLQHDFPQAHLSLGKALLALGEYEEGWRELEWRLHPQLASLRQFNLPRWDGMLTPGSTLLIHAEEDIGDTILASRYLPFIAAKQVHVVFQCDRKLVPIMENLATVARVIDMNAPLPYHDAQLPLMSLPGLFTTRVDRIPGNVPYLSASEPGIAKWREKLSQHEDKIRIGLCWSDIQKYASDDARSFPVELLEQLVDLPHVVFVNLQAEAPDEVARLKEKIFLLDFMAEVEDFADLAALMTNLNLIISADAAALHLAGALALNTWGLLPQVADWQWIGEKHSSLWYPRMTLFKQPAQGNWEDVMHVVKQQLLAAIPNDDL